MRGYSAPIIAFLITAALLLALRPLARSIGLVDHPSGRKNHSGVVPVIGGISMLGGLLIAVLMSGELSHEHTVVLLAVVFMVAIGAVDDRFDLAPSSRLLAHAAAAIALTYGTGLVVRDLGNLLGFGDIGLGWLALPFTVIACMTLVNAFNMLDGLDGLAGGCGLIAFAGFVAIALLHGAHTPAMLAFSTLGACAGFLMFNLPMKFNRKLRTFMGDAGSTLLGFMLACVALILIQPARADIPPVFIVWTMPIPIFEVFTTTARRVFCGRSPMQADHDHFHDKFVRAGFSIQLTFLLYVIVSAGAACFGVAALEAGVPESLMFALFVAFFVVWLVFVRLAPAVGRVLPLRLRRDVENLPY